MSECSGRFRREPGGIILRTKRKMLKQPLMLGPGCCLRRTHLSRRLHEWSALMTEHIVAVFETEAAAAAALQSLQSAGIPSLRNPPIRRQCGGPATGAN